MLREKIANDMRDAMKAREAVRVATLRMLMTAVKNSKVEKRHELSDDEVLEVDRAKRRSAVANRSRRSRRAAGTDLVEKETAELAVLEAYLPERLGDDELAALVDEAIAETGASSPKQMGDVMKALMPKLRGRADGGQVSAMVKARLGA